MQAENSDSDSEDEQEDDIQHQNPAYSEFLEFLKFGCGGSSSQFYPAIVIILSKLPQSVCRSIIFLNISLTYRSYFLALYLPLKNYFPRSGLL